jgi:hypothetical protein
MPKPVRVVKGYQTWMEMPARAESPELDFGIWWVKQGTRYPRWRVSWIEDTGELYAKALDNSDLFVIMGYFPSEQDVKAHMDGWSVAAVKVLDDWCA